MRCVYISFGYIWTLLHFFFNISLLILAVFSPEIFFVSLLSPSHELC